MSSFVNLVNSTYIIPQTNIEGNTYNLKYFLIQNDKFKHMRYLRVYIPWSTRISNFQLPLSSLSGFRGRGKSENVGNFDLSKVINSEDYSLYNYFIGDRTYVDYSYGLVNDDKDLLVTFKDDVVISGPGMMELYFEVDINDVESETEVEIDDEIMCR